MKFYGLTDNTNNSRGWAYAISIIPKSELITINCPECGTRVSYPSGEFDVVIESGSKYPDNLQCGAYPFLIVSEKVVSDWESNGVTGFEKLKVNIAKANSEKLKNIEPPQYYHILVKGKCELNLKEMGVTLVKTCKCGKKNFEPVTGFPFVIKEETWDGSDLFISDLFPRVYFCSEKLIYLAGKNKRTNFLFQAPEAMSEWGAKGIDYIKLARVTQIK